MAFKTRFGERTRVGFETDGPSRTVKSHAATTDINRIVQTYAMTGVPTHVARGVPQYGDFTRYNDLHQALLLVEEADEYFRSLPANVRRACGNDPVEFERMLATPEGAAALVEAGLQATLPEPVESPVPEPAAEPTEAPGGAEAPPEAP